jgi:biotin carboxyl carrier protein
VATKHRLKLGDDVKDVEIEESGQTLLATLDGVRHELRLERVGDSAEYCLIIDGRPHRLFAEESAQGFEIVVNGRAYPVATTRFSRPDVAARAEMLPAHAEEEWVQISPMAGVVQKVLVAPDDRVEAGDPLLVIEAMKMQNELHAHRSGQVKAVYVTAGQQVEPGTPLIVLL